MPFNPNSHQHAIFDFVRAGEGDGVVCATAGSGKTTTLRHVTSLLPNHFRVCFLAFNKNICADLRRTLPSFSVVQTIHTLGKRAIDDYAKTHGFKVNVDKQKLDNLVLAFLTEMEGSLTNGELKESAKYMKKLFALARFNCVDLKNEQCLREISIRYNLSPPSDPRVEDKILAAIPGLHSSSIQAFHQEGMIDFDDMISLPRELSITPKQFDFICVDEAQDLSKAMLQLVLSARAPGGRILFVGDSRQAINGFAGADTDSIENIIRETEAVGLPLSVTYRCPKSHVRLAKQIAPEIEALEHAPEGNVHVIKYRALSKWARPGNLIICRANSPLISACLDLNNSGIKASILGIDMVERLLELSKRIFSSGFNDWKTKIGSYRTRETNRLNERIQDPSLRESLLSVLLDEISCVERFALELASKSQSLTMKTLKGLIKAAFCKDDVTNQVVLSSIHKAKGREANRVFLLYPHLMPAEYAATAEAIRGEACIQFVALTRAKRDLIFVEENKSLAEQIYDDLLTGKKAGQ